MVSKNFISPYISTEKKQKNNIYFKDVTPVMFWFGIPQESIMGFLFFFSPCVYVCVSCTTNTNIKIGFQSLIPIDKEFEADID